MSEKSERLFEALSEIDEEKIDQAAPVEGRRRFHWKRWSVLAAALVLAVGVGSYVLPRMGGGAGNTGAGGAGADGASTFMSYAGPVFPLTLMEADSAITADRKITLDFAPWMPVWWSNEEEAASRTNLTEEQRQEVLDDYNEWYPEGGRYQYSTDLLVTDSYTLTNSAGEGKKITLLYPFVSSLRELNEDSPTLIIDGTRLETTLHAGQYSGGFYGTEGSKNEGRYSLAQLNSWEQYRTLLEDGSYQKGAFEDYPDLSDIPVVVYEFTAPRGTGGEAPSIRAEFELDYEKTQVLSWNFNGRDSDYDTGWMGMGFFIPESTWTGYGDSRYLIVLGDDIQNMAIQGYENLGCDPDEKIEASVTVRRSETSLEDILRDVAQERYSRWEEEEKADFEMYFGLLKDNLVSNGILSDDPAERYGNDRLDDLDFYNMDRVFYLDAEITVPARGSVRVNAEMTKEGSYDFYCAHTENQGVYGYDMVTWLGSNLTCTGQTAVLEDRGQIEIIRQNFGFDLENSINTVVLEQSAEHYYLEVKGREGRFEK